jgi:Tfp pilus assembly protein PilX
MTKTIERLRSRRGVALPLALTGLVVVSLLVTSAVLTSSTESAIAGAQQGSARSLYDAEGALNQRLRDMLTAGTGLSAGQVNVVLPENQRTVRITTTVFRNVLNAAGDTRTITASLLAEPLNGANQPFGRAVVAMVQQTASFNTMSLKVNEGAVVGTDLTVGGNSKVIDRSTQCADSVGGGAVMHAAGARVNESGSGEISGAIRSSANSGQAFVNQILDGRSLTDFANLANIKFGAMFGQAAFPTNAHPAFNNANTKLRWGCPASMGVTCSDTVQAKYYPVVAIDAQGGAVDLQGDHGQGIIIVLNGSLQITGNFKFKGIMLIDGYIDMSGTGGQTGSKIEGAVVAFGNNTNQRSRVDESETQGNAVISYNRCEVNAAQEAYNKMARNNPTYAFPTTAFAWYELVR